MRKLPASVPSFLLEPDPKREETQFTFLAGFFSELCKLALPSLFPKIRNILNPHSVYHIIDTHKNLI